MLRSQFPEDIGLEPPPLPVGADNDDDDDGGGVDEEVVGDVYLAQKPSKSFVFEMRHSF